MKILINYADLTYFQSRKQNSKSGISVAGFDKVIEYDRPSIDSNFQNEHADILNQPLGAGYWLWKPYIILTTLLAANDDDIIHYSDAGCTFTGNMAPYFDLCLNEKRGLILFRGNHINKTYTKRDCFYYMGMNTEKYIEGEQLTASHVLYRKTDFTLSFFSEWLKHMTDARISTDMPNTCGLENDEGFLDHRYDQSVLSLLSIHHDVTLIKDLSQWGDSFYYVYDQTKLFERGDNDLPCVVNHHRNRR